MNILFDNEELLRLITNLYTLTGIRANIFDLSGRDICLNYDHMPFCELINGCSEGHARCVECDAREVARAGRDTVHFYRCHAGICEAIIPIRAEGVPIAYLSFGQFLNAAESIESQWEATRSTLNWYTGSMTELHRAFHAFRQYPMEEISAYAEILKALASYIHLSGMIQTAEYSDLQRLEIYLDQHYMEKLSLATISEALNISRTKLCALAKRLSGGQTLTRMIAERRVSAAKLLLLKGDTSVADIAESVGISDYNYFTKIFRSITGMTPTAFRKKNRRNNDFSRL